MTYRSKLESDKGIEYSGNACVICGWAKKDSAGNYLVIGSHVRKFANTSDYDRFDNIIALCPNHHTEFDKGNITILFHKQICVHINNSDEFHLKKIVGNINHIQPGYFDYHNKNIFKGKIPNKD